MNKLFSSRAAYLPKHASRVILIAGLLVVVLVFSAFSFAPSAHAATQPSVVPHVGPHLSQPYNFSTTFKSPHLNVCITWKVFGTFTYSSKVISRGGATWYNQKLTNPTMSASVHGYNKGLCNTTGKVTGISLRQSWDGYSCGFNPSLSVSIPWGISFGGWPTCASRNQAEHDSNYGSGGVFTQYNSGSPTTFGDSTNNAGSPPCYGVYVDTTAYETNISDSYTSNPWEVCLPL